MCVLPQLSELALTSIEWLIAMGLAAQWFQLVNSSWFDERQSNDAHMAPCSSHRHASRCGVFRWSEGAKIHRGEGAHVFFADRISWTFLSAWRTRLENRDFPRMPRECRKSVDQRPRSLAGRTKRIRELDELAPARGPGYESKIPGA